MKRRQEPVNIVSALAWKLCPDEDEINKGVEKNRFSYEYLNLPNHLFTIAQICGFNMHYVSKETGDSYKIAFTSPLSWEDLTFEKMYDKVKTLFVKKNDGESLSRENSRIRILNSDTDKCGCILLKNNKNTITLDSALIEHDEIYVDELKDFQVEVENGLMIMSFANDKVKFKFDLKELPLIFAFIWNSHKHPTEDATARKGETKQFPYRTLVTYKGIHKVEGFKIISDKVAIMYNGEAVYSLITFSGRGVDHLIIHPFYFHQVDDDYYGKINISTHKLEKMSLALKIKLYMKFHNFDDDVVCVGVINRVKNVNHCRGEDQEEERFRAPPSPERNEEERFCVSPSPERNEEYEARFRAPPSPERNEEEHLHSPPFLERYDGDEERPPSSERDENHVSSTTPLSEDDNSSGNEYQIIFPQDDVNSIKTLRESLERFSPEREHSPIPSNAVSVERQVTTCHSRQRRDDNHRYRNNSFRSRSHHREVVHSPDYRCDSPDYGCDSHTRNSKSRTNYSSDRRYNSRSRRSQSRRNYSPDRRYNSQSRRNYSPDRRSRSSSFEHRLRYYASIHRNDHRNHNSQSRRCNLYNRRPNSRDDSNDSHYSRSRIVNVYLHTR